MPRNSDALIHFVKQFGQPLGTNSMSAHPAHANMLLYERGFCNPLEPSFVVFPAFNSRQHDSSTKLLARAWCCFWMTLDCIGLAQSESVLQKWVTYIHPPGDSFTLVPQTLDEYLKSNSELRISGWRRVFAPVKAAKR